MATTSHEDESGELDRPATAHEDDESIDQYMAQLMQRLGSLAGGEPVQDEAAIRASQRATVSRQAFLGADHPYRQRTQEEQAASDAEEKASRRAAVQRQRSSLESLTSLAAMRELATATASSAISSHTRRQLKKSIRAKLSLSVAALVLGVSLILGRTLWGFQNWQFYVGVAGIFLALLWVVQFLVLTGRLKLNKPGGLIWNRLLAKKTDDETPSTPDTDPTPPEDKENGRDETTSS